MSDLQAEGQADRVFGELLEREAHGQALDLESACQLHPALAEELRSLYLRWRSVQAVLDSSFAAELGAAEVHKIPPDPDPERYLQEAELGRGGMGIVYRVSDSRLERAVAMKVLRQAPGEGAAAAGTHARRLTRFVEEARVAGRLGHPGIVPVHELSRGQDGEVFFTMPLVEGHDLLSIFDMVRSGAGGWSRTRALAVLHKVSEAMAYAHSRAVIHRDLKPANIMVGRFGETYVMDWGLARVMESTEPLAGAADDGRREGDAGVARELGPALTLEGDVVGTPAYMSPEQAQGRVAELDGRADVYALGAILYHLLALRMPHVRPGEAPEPRALLARVLRGPPAPLTALRPAPPAELIAICERAMERDLARRYPSMQAFSEDLRAFLEGRVVHAYESGGWAELKKWIGRNRKLATMSGVALLAVVGGLAAALYIQAKGRAQVMRLSDVKRLAERRAEASNLWPALPHQIGHLEAWLASARELAARLQRHEEWLADLDREAAVRHERKRPGDERHPWTFHDDGKTWQHEKLIELVDGLEAFTAPDAEANSLPEVEQRLANAKTIARRSLEEPAARWDEAIEAVRVSSVYGGLVLAPQLGLVPVGPDRHSGLWEFAHLQSGQMAQHDTDGQLVTTPGTGIVLVLVPGGRFDMGSRPPDEQHPLGSPNVVPWHKDMQMEQPVHPVELAPFFLSKHELSQAQWERMTQREEGLASVRGDLAGRLPMLLPMASVSWFEADLVLGRFQLCLPTEAQWEYAARAGTSSRWWCGDEAAYLPAFEYVDQGGGTIEIGSCLPNPFGFREILGNVAEWCRDLEGGYKEPVLPWTGERVVSGTKLRAYRGGSFLIDATYARCASRYYATQAQRQSWIGIRPARCIDP